MDDKTSAREQEKIEFARQLAERLDAGCNDGCFDRLVLIAPPAFLGLLRDKLSKKVMERVYKQIDKNLVQKPADVVREHVSVAV